MANRKPIRRDVQTRILIGSRRRCCLCYFWDGHKQQTPGQIAHIDRDSSNADEDNLAYLCLDHHNQYDRKEGLCKDITPDELRHAKQFLVRSFDGASEPELLITITLDGISGDNSVDVPRIVRLIEEVVRSNGELTIKATRPGSVRITLGLNPTETQRLVEAVERGTFEGTGIRDLAIEHVDERLILRDTRLGCSEVSDLRLSIAASNVRKIEESLCGFLTRFGGRAKS